MRRRLAYVFDQHIIDATDAAATHVAKFWLPTSGAGYRVQVVRSGWPTVDVDGQEWHLYQCAVWVSDVNGYYRQGHQVRLLTNGPQGHGGIHLVHNQQGGLAVFTGCVPTQYGFGWALWPASRVIATDVVNFNAVYRMVS